MSTDSSPHHIHPRCQVHLTIAVILILTAIKPTQGALESRSRSRRFKGFLDPVLGFQQLRRRDAVDPLDLRPKVAEWPMHLILDRSPRVFDPDFDKVERFAKVAEQLLITVRGRASKPSGFRRYRRRGGQREKKGHSTDDHGAISRSAFDCWLTHKTIVPTAAKAQIIRDGKRGKRNHRPAKSPKEARTEKTAPKVPKANAPGL